MLHRRETVRAIIICSSRADAYVVSVRSIVDIDPYQHSAIPVHICAMVELELKSDLYYRAHQLVEGYPDRAVSWFAVACYYYLLGKYETARSYFKYVSHTSLFC